MTRADFQQLAQERLLDAEALLALGRWSAAYYLAGYAVECALKACIAKKTKAGDFPPKDAAKCYIHNLALLIERAGLNGLIEAEFQNKPDFATNWSFVKDWSEECRYQTIDETKAKLFFLALTDPQNGVFPWCMHHS